MIRSLIRASTTAVRRALAWNIEDLGPPQELTLFNFASQNDLNKWFVYSDADLGGLSTASFDLNVEGGSTAIFSGNLSVELKEHGMGKMTRSGFSGIRTRQTNGVFDLEHFNTVAFRVKGDGRCYISTLRTQSWTGEYEDGHTWQAFVFAPKDEWYQVRIPFSRYLPTWKGKIIETHMEMHPGRICGMTLGVSAEGGPKEAVLGPGGFRLELDWIKALHCSDQRTAKLADAV